MTNGELAFIALAEELNFTKAAAKIYISQQGLSDHIRRLEQEFDTVLVNRKPEVSLTDSGQELYNMLLAKQAMELDIRRVISDIDHGESGEVRVGITSSRLRVFGSDIIQRYYEAHPNVHIHVVSDLTAILLQMLDLGELDLVIGADPLPEKGIEIEHVFDDPLYLAVPEDIAKERIGDADSTDIKVFRDIPFIRDINLSPSGSTIDRFLAKRNINLHKIIATNDYNEQAALCSRLGAGMFCSGSFAFSPGGEVMRKGLKILRIDGLTHSVSICIITSSERVYPMCVRNFIDVARDSMLYFSEHKQL